MDPKKKIYLTLIIFSGLIILTITFLIHPLFQKIKKISENLILEKRKLLSFRAETEDLREIKISYQKWQENLEKIDKLFIDSEIPIDFINFLEKNATDSNLLIEIGPVVKSEAKIDPWPSLFFNITASGYFPNFFKFLGKLENSPFLVEISDLNIKRINEKISPEDSSPGNIKATFSIKVFAK